MRTKVGWCTLLGLLLSGCGGVARDAGRGQAASGASGQGLDVSGASSGGSSSSAGGAGANETGSGTGSFAGTDGSGGALSNTGAEDAGTGGLGAPPAMQRARACDTPMPRPRDGGYLLCADGSLRRSSAAACEAALPRAAPDAPIVFDECTSDSECTSAPYGFCAYGACKYGCVADDDCASDQACFCGDFIGTCIPASCRTDADCPADFPCTGFQAVGFATPDALACQSPLDECVTDAQCGSLNPRVTCKVQLDHRVCYTDPIE